jgi:hypothetical protein
VLHRLFVEAPDRVRVLCPAPVPEVAVLGRHYNSRMNARLSFRSMTGACNRVIAPSCC